ncbi:TPA: hypothetical protein KOX55_000394 [Clostridioides difficile]|nr:hypothetical protein [Clostridioides difficile]
MESNTEIINRLLEKDCYIVDFLPETVSKESKGQFFDVEYYLLNSKKYCALKDKFVSVILKLMCYYHISVLWNGWIDRPKPELIENAVTEIMVNHSGTLNCLFGDENMLLVFDWDCLNLSVYNPPEKVQQLFEQIAFSEGLFWRKSET